MRTGQNAFHARPALAAAVLLAVAGCNASTPGNVAIDMAGATGADLTSGPPPADMAGGSTAGTVMGSLGGMQFDTVTTALWIGAPDDPATTVVYVFDKAVKCGQLAVMGWDKRIPDMTQFLEMKMFGTMPASYTVTSSMTPAPGEASVNYTLSSQTGVPAETFGNTGKIVMATRTAMTSATGTFNIDFGGGDMLKGTYNAVFCPGGHEP